MTTPYRATELFEQTQGTGQFVKKAYIIRSEFINPNLFDDVIKEHRDYLDKLAADGTLLAAGPFVPGGSESRYSGVGMIVVYADSEDDARLIAENDPMHRKGVRKFTVDFWLLKHMAQSYIETL
ncbi:hypothetical protein BGZ63DRAFT_425493 [Mariannaea sp. PMI_226]|nr:hypothetical protein BGZ63DRAFT_425493 [Mariannaea sp. PMI_226]